MNKRKLKYYCWFTWREYLVEGPGLVLEMLVAWFCESSYIRGFVVADPTPETRRYFDQLIQSALDVIAKVDPMAFGRVKQEIRYIVNAPARFGSAYCRPLKICELDIRYCYAKDDFRKTSQLIAGAIIHVATIGRLYSNRIIRTHRSRERCNVLCFKHTQRFLRRCGIDEKQYQHPGEMGHETRIKHTTTELARMFNGNPKAEAALWEALCNSSNRSDCSKE